MLGKRVAGAAVLIPIVGTLVYVGGLWLFALVLVAALLAGIEYAQLVRRMPTTGLLPRQVVPSYVLGLGSVVALVADAQWPQLGILGWAVVAVPLAALAVHVLSRNAPGSLLCWALTVSGALYVGYPIGYVIRLRSLEQGLPWLALALLSTWISDSGAYFVGRAVGRRKLCRSISPHKTWEGAVAGLTSGVLAVILLGRLLLNLGWLGGSILGIVLVIAATLGDLSVSVIKRQTGVKDSSHLIPGHGGMLDRLDSLIFVVPIVYYFATIIAL